jgi:hypothetical protein
MSLGLSWYVFQILQVLEHQRTHSIFMPKVQVLPTVRLYRLIVNSRLNCITGIDSGYCTIVRLQMVSTCPLVL